MSMTQGLCAVVAIVGLAGGCAPRDEAGAEVDPNLEQIDGKGDGQRTPIDPEGTYRLEITSVQGDPLADDARDASLYVAAAGARTPICITHSLICEYGASGRLLLDSGEERTFTGRELRDGLEYQVFDAGGRGGSGSSAVDKLLSATRFSLFGAEVSFSVKKPFSSNRTFVVRARWVF